MGAATRCSAFLLGSIAVRPNRYYILDMPTDIQTVRRAEVLRPRYSGEITVQISFPCGRVYRHVKRFDRFTGRSDANALMQRINANGGLSLQHVHTSAHWIRTGRMSGCVQVNKVVAENFESYMSGNEPAVRYTLSGPVAQSWGEKPKDGAVWHFGTQYDRTGRSFEEIKADVESNWRPSIFGCESKELWPYVDSEIEKAIAAVACAA
jgi:hypothetical protein